MSLDRTIKNYEQRNAEGWEDLDAKISKLDPSNPKDVEEYYELIQAFKTDYSMGDQAKSLAHSLTKDAIQDMK